jgi:hypothetical protein
MCILEQLESAMLVGSPIADKNTDKVSKFLPLGLQQGIPLCAWSQDRLLLFLRNLLIVDMLVQ